MVSFNEKHPPFNQAISIENFMKNHSQFICEDTYQHNIFGYDSDDESDTVEHITDAGPFEYQESDDEEGEDGEDEEGDGEEGEVIEESDGEDGENVIIEESDESVAQSSFDEDDES